MRRSSSLLLRFYIVIAMAQEMPAVLFDQLASLTDGTSVVVVYVVS